MNEWKLKINTQFKNLFRIIIIDNKMTIFNSREKSKINEK